MKKLWLAALLPAFACFCLDASGQAPAALAGFSASPTAPQVGDCVAIQSLNSGGVVVGDAGTGSCGTGGSYSYNKQVPTTGFSIVFPNATAVLVLAPAGTLATGTITMPAAPTNGQQACVTSSQIITALTVSANAGQSIVAAPTAMSAGGFCYLYIATSTTWFRLY